MIDKFQERYLKHQERKSRMLSGEIENGEEKIFDNYAFAEIFRNRVSQRIFNEDRITDDELNYIKEAIVDTPSSCNRQAVQIKMIRHSDDKDKLEELLVGGSKWISKADIIILLLADMEAYKSPAEVNFMPYLDAGFIGMSVYYASTAIGVGCCFVNPNIREQNKEEFKNIYAKDYRFCGAIALGHYDKKAINIKKSNNIFI